MQDGVATDANTMIQLTQRSTARFKLPTLKMFLKKNKKKEELVDLKEDDLDDVEAKYMNDGEEDNAVEFYIWDYGGQSVFYTLHHLFLTEHGVYCFVFDLTRVLKEDTEALQFLQFWIDSVQLHAAEAKALLVGTRMDLLEDKVKDIKKIQEVLTERLNFRQLNVIFNMHVEPTLRFFPVDNKSREGIGLVSESIVLSVRDTPHVNYQVSLRWVKLLDDLLEGEEMYFNLDDVYNKALTYSIKQEECQRMLRFFS